MLGWGVKYEEEFIPSHEDAYTIILIKRRNMGGQEGPVRHSYRIYEPGKVVLTIENVSSKKKQVFYRYKTKKIESSV